MPSEILKAFVVDSLTSLDSGQLKEIILGLIDSPTADIEEIGKVVWNVKDKGRKGIPISVDEDEDKKKGKGAERGNTAEKGWDDDMELEHQGIPEPGSGGCGERRTDLSEAGSGNVGKRKCESFTRLYRYI